MGFQIDGESLGQMFETANTGYQRQHSFDNHVFTPRFMGTKFEVTRRFARFLETEITQDNRFFIKLIGNGTKGLVMNISGVPIPSHHLASVIHQLTELNADNPASVGFAFLTHLLRTASFAYWRDQFNAISVNHGKKGGIGQQTIRPFPMAAQGPLNAGAIRQSDKQTLEVAFQPAVEGSKVPAFERVQQSNRHQLTRMQQRIRPFFNFAHAIIYQTEQRNDKVFGGHGSLPLGCVVTSKDRFHDLFQLAPLVS
jgi:hypothetical protein